MNPLAGALVPAAAVILAGASLSPTSATSATGLPAEPRAATGESPVTLPDLRTTPRPAFASPVAGFESATVLRPAAGSAVAGSGSSRPGLVVPAGRWQWPLSPRPELVRPFLRPASRYGAGHRGVDLAARLGQEVHAVEAGAVTHVGVIAGRGTVTVTHRSGIRSTYEPVAPVITVGSVVTTGQVLGGIDGTGSHCDPGPCLHLGALRGTNYLDPLVFLAGGRVRLLPLGQAPDG